MDSTRRSTSVPEDVVTGAANAAADTMDKIARISIRTVQLPPISQPGTCQNCLPAIATSAQYRSNSFKKRGIFGIDGRAEVKFGRGIVGGIYRGTANPPHRQRRKRAQNISVNSWPAWL